MDRRDNRLLNDHVPAWYVRLYHVAKHTTRRVGQETGNVIEAMFHTKVPVTWSSPVIRCDNLIWHHPADSQYPCTCGLPLGHEPQCVCIHQLRERSRRGAVSTATRRDHLSPQPPLTAPQDQYTTPLPPHARKTVTRNE